MKHSNDYGKTALTYALSAKVPSMEVVLALTKAGADVNKMDRGGKTPLIYAVISGCPSIVEYLLENGADPSVQDKQGRKAIDYAKDSKVASQASNKLIELLETPSNRSSATPKLRKF